MPLSYTSTPTSCQDEKESDHDSPIESNACVDLSLKKEKKFDLQPVPPHSSGEGLPYAPEGWPNPGDVWGWRVLRRTNNAGYFYDRNLYLPKSLQITSHKKQGFRTKREVQRYIKSKFPDMGIEAFFGLFSWQIPATVKTPRKVGLPAAESFPTTPPLKSLETKEDATATQKIGTERKLKRRTQICSKPTRKSSRLLNVSPRLAQDQDANGIVDLGDFSRGEEARVDSTEISKGISDSEGSAVQTAREKDPNGTTVLQNLDDYLDTLENMIVEPHTETSPDQTAAAATTLDNEMIQNYKRKLSFLLDVDFSSLLSCNAVVLEVATLASKICQDPTLSNEQLAQLKLVEQLPLVSEAFLEAKADIEEADKFFGDLEAKKQKVIGLKNDYKEKVAQMESEIERKSLAIQEIDDQIQQLQSKRKELCGALETMQRSKNELASGGGIVANSILTLVGEIRLCLSDISKWELKKANSAKRVAEILEKFISLRGFKF